MPLTGWPLWWRLLVISAMWGTAFPMLRYAAAHMPPFALSFARGVVSAVALLAFAYATGALRGLRGGFVRNGLILGTTNGWLPNVMTATAVITLAAASASLIQSTAPLFVAVLSFLFLPQERPTPRTFVGLAVGLVGIAVILGPGALAGGAGLLAGLLMVATALSYATGTVYVRWYRPGSPVALSAGQQVFGAIGAGLLSLSFDAPAAYDQRWLVWGAVVWIGILSSAVPLTMFLSLVQRARATDASMTGYLQPVFAAIVSAILLGEVPEARVFAGGAVVLLGVWLATGRRDR
ncbi:DMT family transporter [Roseomonas sp. CCTCC AB2023176]|uniref:DMT family transporter n=1 Tax=Roseomonas sp. CCTCC AB2023176 TaxID=3342640 RepID=UPI0035D55CF4